MGKLIQKSCIVNNIREHLAKFMTNHTSVSSSHKFPRHNAKVFLGY